MEEKKKVLPTLELLEEMESLEIHGGIGGPGNDPDDFNMYSYFLMRLLILSTHVTNAR